MDLESRPTPRLRDRAVDRLNHLTTGTAVIGVLATAGIATIAAATTHAPGASTVSSTSSGGTSDDSLAPGTEPEDDTTRPPTSGGLQAPAAGGQGTAPQPVRGSGRSHASTGGS
jgi:hypothetical protein